MKRFIANLLVLVLLSGGFYAKAQNYSQRLTNVMSPALDYRAALNINGRITEISVAPDERIWLTTYLGGIYYTNSIDSNWHYGRLDPSAKDDEEDYLGLNKPTLDRISFFNADTAIMTGFMQFSDDWKSPYDGYYRTTDGGRTWELRSFGGDGWIYEACVNSRGDAWLGTKGMAILYSSSRFIESCLTEDFYGREAFDNAVLLMKIGDYYCRERW